MLIERKDYLDFLIRWKDKQLIKIVSGIRRCGKSTLFDIYKNYLLDNGVSPNQIISINFEDLAYEELKDYRKLYDHINSLLQPNQTNYVFLDEIQHVPQFELAVDSLYIKQNCDVYITGSNAFFMSSELATMLTGRYVELKMLPLSFKEYSTAFNKTEIQLTNEQIYAMYTSEGSFPYTLKLNHNKLEILEYLEGIYNSILLKDVIARNKINDIALLESVLKFLFDNIGNLSSPTKIANTLTSNNRKVDSRTIEKYLTALVDSMIINKVCRYNVKGKTILSNNEKYYLTDLAFRNILLGKKATDIGHILENIVYLELIRRGNKVYVCNIPDGEIDFVADNGNSISYYQVSASVLDSTTLQRELSAFDKINDNYPKYLLTFDTIGANTDHNGIIQLNVFDWLLQ